MNIRIRVKNLVNRHQTSNPFKIAEDLKIHVKFRPYKKTKGYFIKIRGNKFIVINENLNEAEQLVVMAHELGHALLHSNKYDFLKYEKGIYLTADAQLFNQNCIYENQANKFASELLLINEVDILEAELDKDIYNSLSKIKYMNIK